MSSPFTFITSDNTLFRGRFRRLPHLEDSRLSNGPILLNIVRRYWRLTVALGIVLLGLVAYEAFFMEATHHQALDFDQTAKTFGAAATQVVVPQYVAPTLTPDPQPQPPVTATATPSDSSKPPRASYQLYAWGLAGGREGLPAGVTAPGHLEVPTLVLGGMPVYAVGASGHTVVLAASGKVFTFGRNDSSGGFLAGSPPVPDAGQLGRAGFAKKPGEVNWGELSGGRAVLGVCAGRFHTAAVTEDGALITWGLNDHGQLGRPGAQKDEASGAPCTCGATCRDGVPSRVELPESAVGLACSRYSTYAIGTSGALYTMGRDFCDGSLAKDAFEISKCAVLYKPRKVAGISGAVEKVATGYTHWAALTKNGDVFTCSTGDDGYGGYYNKPFFDGNKNKELGRDVKGEDAMRPGRVNLPGPAVDVGTSRVATYAVMGDGRLLSWGGHPNLGRPASTDAASPLPSAGFEGNKVKAVAGGEYYAVAATEQGLFTTGSHGYNTLGVAGRKEDAKDSFIKAQLPEGLQAKGVVAGYQHVFALVTGTPSAAVAPVQTEAKAAVVEQKTAVESAPRVEWTREKALAYLDQAQAPARSPASIWKDWVEGFQRPAPAHNPPSPTSMNNAEKLKYVVDNFAQDIWSVLSSVQMDESTASPCWTGPSGSKPEPDLRCLPGYHILGVSKCGTTDLYARLMTYSGASESKNKGPHWWDECDYPPKHPCTVGGNGGFDNYVDLYTVAVDKIKKGNKQVVTGDASSNTFTADKVWLRGHSPRPNVTMSEYLRMFQPYVRNVIMFRNPVDRHFSAFNYYNHGLSKEGKLTPEYYATVVVRDLDNWKKCISAGEAMKLSPADAEQRCVVRFEPQQLVKGMYAAFMEGWMTHWPRDQLLFLRNEDYSEYPREHLEAVIRFIGARPATEPEMEKMVGKQRTNALGTNGRGTAGKRPEMLPETRKLLEEFYRPWNERLAKILGDGRWLWN